MSHDENSMLLISMSLSMPGTKSRSSVGAAGLGTSFPDRSATLTSVNVFIDVSQGLGRPQLAARAMLLA